MTRKERFVRWCHRNTAYILLALAFLLGALVGSLISCTISARANAAENEGIIERTCTLGQYEQNVLPDEPVLIEISHLTEAKPVAQEQAEIEMLAKLIWGEARGIESDTEKAAVVWCVLNRVDSPMFPNTISEVVTEDNQFVGYSESFPVLDEFKKIASDVLSRWDAEKNGKLDAGRVLPKEYVFFSGDGARNHFTAEWLSSYTWDWSLPSPYES